ncbi:MAG: hypothetical protein COB02_07275 [Candidatus Cloacimonadota bacterium]|nr:MAG: hypothetical protein COB02_07275 [Candidatus Cloacimonadota bacterium]
MKKILNLVIFLSVFVLTVCSNSHVDSAKLNLTKALSTFTQLRDSGDLKYSVEINKKRFQSKLNLIKKSHATLLASQNFASSHSDASTAFIDIVGLRTAGSIYFNTKKARLLYTSAFKSLRDAVLTLYHLKINNTTITSLNNIEQSSLPEKEYQTRFVVTKKNSYYFTVTTFDPNKGIVSKEFSGKGDVRYALNFVMFKKDNYNCTAVSYLNQSNSFTSNTFGCEGITMFESESFLKNKKRSKNFKKVYLLK